MRPFALALLTASLVAGGAVAAETATYQYDANGRLVMVVRSGTINNGAVTTYQHDTADNRVRATVTGAP